MTTVNIKHSLLQKSGKSNTHGNKWAGHLYCGFLSLYSTIYAETGPSSKNSFDNYIDEQARHTNCIVFKIANSLSK